MTRLDRCIHRVRRRWVLNRILQRTGSGLTIAVIIGLVILLLDRTLLLNLPALVIWSIAGLGFLLGVIAGLLAQPTAAEAARRIDRAMRLRDQFSTATSLRVPDSSTPERTGPTYDPAFAGLVNRDAEQLAGSISPQNVVPYQWPRTWSAALGLIVLLWTGVVFLPPLRSAEAETASPERTEQLAALEEERDRLRESIDETISQLRDRPERPTGAREREALEALDRLAEQLSESDPDPDSIRRTREESAAKFNEIAEELDEQVRRRERSAEKLTERFSGLEPREAPMTAREFEEALRRGDFGDAAERLDELLQQRDGLEEAERDAVADRLDELNRSAEERAREDLLDHAERMAQLEDRLRNQGLDDELIERLLHDRDPMSRRDLERLLREEEIDEELAQRLARELERMREQRDALEQADLDAEEIREALREAAEQLRDDEPAEVDESDAPDLDEPDRDPDADPDRTDPETETPAGEGEDEDEDAERDEREAEADQDPAAGDRGAGAESETGERTADDDDASASDDESEAGGQTESQPEESQTDEEASSSEASPPDGADEEGETGEGADGESAEDGESRAGEPGGETGSEGDPDAAPDAGDAAGGEDGGETGEEDAAGAGEGQDDAADDDPAAEAESGQAGEGEGAQRSPADRLREMQERANESERERQTSEEMRQRARELLDSLSEEERQELAEQLRDLREPSGGDGAGDQPDPTPGERVEPGERLAEESEDIDLRDPEDPMSELVAEWFGEQEERTGEPGTRSSEERREQIRRAQEVAERAVNESAVPGRYHQTIRRYFNRLRETAPEETSGNGGTAAEEGGNGS